MLSLQPKAHIALKAIVYIIGISVILLSGCYSFKGFSIDPSVETFRVESFEIAPQASLASATAGIEFAQQLQDKVRGETRLRFKTEEPDIVFSGQITKYEVRSVAPNLGETVAANQLVVGIKVDYLDTKNEANNWQSSWEQNAEFDANADLLSVQASLVSQINKRLLEDIFNRAFNNW